MARKAPVMLALLVMDRKAMSEMQNHREHSDELDEQYDLLEAEARLCGHDITELMRNDLAESTKYSHQRQAALRHLRETMWTTTP